MPLLYFELEEIVKVPLIIYLFIYLSWAHIVA